MGGDAGVIGTDANHALAAVREVELREAAEAAEAIRRDAAERAEHVVEQARSEGAELVARRCAAAERLAELGERDQVAEARARSRETVLRAQQSMLDEARAAVHAAVRNLVGDPRLDHLFERLARDARKRLAACGPVAIEPVVGGGFVARAGSREIDCSLPVLVDRVLDTDTIAAELQELGR
jgi:ATP synthase (E/31 kDa) subunit